MNDRAQLAAETALELVKHLITLSSGVLALSATFVTMITGGPERWTVVLLGLAWLALTASVVAGLQTVSAIVKSRLDGNEDWSTGYGKKAATISKYSFVMGLALFAAFAFATLVTSSPDEGKEERPSKGQNQTEVQSHTF